jgi:hypothetical protein
MTHGLIVCIRSDLHVVARSLWIVLSIASDGNMCLLGSNQIDDDMRKACYLIISMNDIVVNGINV